MASSDTGQPPPPMSPHDGFATPPESAARSPVKVPSQEKSPEQIKVEKEIGEDIMKRFSATDLLAEHYSLVCCCSQILVHVHVYK